MRFAINRILASAVVTVLVLFIIILGISVKQTSRAKEVEQSSTQNREFLFNLQQFILYILDNETGARGYVLTGYDDFLKPIELSEMNISKGLEKLSEKRSEFPAAVFDSISLLSQKRIEFSKRLIKARREKGVDAAINLVLTGEGKKYTNTIRNSIQALEDRQKQLLSDKQKNNLLASAFSDKILYIVMLAGMALIIIITIRIAADFNKQKVNEQKFIALLDAAPDATVIVNEKGTIQMANQQAENVFGYSKNEMIGQQIELLIPQELHHQHKQHRDNFMKEARIRPMGAGIELRAIRKGGVSFPVEISLSPIKTPEGLLVSASVRDMTDRKKSEEKFRSLLDSAPDATVIVDENGVIQMINHQTENLFGYSRSELIGQTVEIFIPNDLKSKHTQHRGNFIKAARVRSMGAGIELNAVKKNGIQFPVEISLSPIQTEEGMLVSASVRDISIRKQLEYELRNSNAEMEAFTYSVSHDLRAPLRGIIGFTAILEEDYAVHLDDEAKRITSIIKNNTLKMGHLIDDLLAFSRMRKQELIKTKMESSLLVREIINETNQQEAENLIKWDLRSLPPVYADINTIRQVWINLISNAVKYTRKNIHPVIEIGSMNEEGYIIFYVKDNGVGFDEKYADKLFKVFQRLHNAEEFEGTGVGLALVEKIVSRHGGKVWASGKEGEGANFFFSLPNEINES